MAQKSSRSKAVVIYQAKSGAIELRGDFNKETIWATQAQITQLFAVDRTVVLRHIQNVLKQGEVSKKSNVQKMHIANSDKPVVIYSLDIILAVGYRTNSQRAIEFRQWATKTLRSYIIDGYAINKKRIARNYEHFLGIVHDIQKLLPEGSAMTAVDATELVSLFADTWLSLDAYDKEMLSGKLTKKRVALTAEKIEASLADFKRALAMQSEVGELFGAERQAGSVAGIVGNVMQSFGGKELYPSAEEKAAHLLYFMVKNHPFSDGNKRSGAYAFVWFLRYAGILDVHKLTPSALTALTILVAESDPSHKERVVRLILNLVGNKSGT